MQVLANLLDNAVRYTPADGRIELALGMHDGRIRVSVRDHGIGMSADLMAHLFGLFTQGTRKTDLSGGGLGVGLALARHLVEQHDGTLSASSAGLGQGSEFVLSLPALSAGAEAAIGLGDEILDDCASRGDHLPVVLDHRRLAERVDRLQFRRREHRRLVPFVAPDVIGQLKFLEQPENALRPRIFEMMHRDRHDGSPEGWMLGGRGIGLCRNRSTPERSQKSRPSQGGCPAPPKHERPALGKAGLSSRATGGESSRGN